MKLNLLLFPTLVLLSGIVCAAEDEFGLDPFALPAEEEKPEYQSKISLDFIYVGEDHFQYGRFNDLDNSGFVLDSALDVLFRRESQLWHFSGDHLGTSAREMGLTFQDGRGYEVKLDYNETVSHFNDSGRTPYSGDSLLAVPVNWRAASTTAGFDGNLIQGRFNNDLKRKNLALDIKAPLSSGLSTSFAIELEEKQGTRVQGSAIYFNAANPQSVLLPVPVDYFSTALNWELEFEGDALLWTLSWRYLDFNNRQEETRWQNPYLNGLGTAVDYPNGFAGLSGDPDYNQNQLMLTAAYRFTPGIRVVLDAASSETEQTGDLANYTVNPALLVTSPLPVLKSDKPLVNNRLHIAVLTRPLKRVGLDVHYRYRERDNEANRYAWQYVRGDGANQPPADFAVFNRPLSEEREQFEVTADVRFPNRSKLILGYELETVFRNYAAVEDTEEDKLNASYRFSIGETLTNQVQLGYANKQGSTYEWARSFFQLLSTSLINKIPDDQRWINHPLLRQYHIANSENQQVGLRSTWHPLDTWMFQLWMKHDRTRFDKSDLGLIDSESLLASLSASYSPTAALTLQTRVDFRRDERAQRGRSFSGGINKPANITVPPYPQGSDPGRNYDVIEESSTVGIAIDVIWEVSDAVNLSANYTYLDVASEHEFQTLLSGRGNALPEIETTLHSLDADISYRFSERLTLNGRLSHYRYEDVDFALDGVNVASAPRVLLGGQQSLDESVNVLAVSMTYLF